MSSTQIPSRRVRFASESHGQPLDALSEIVKDARSSKTSSSLNTFVRRNRPWRPAEEQLAAVRHKTRRETSERVDVSKSEADPDRRFILALRIEQLMQAHR